MSEQEVTRLQGKQAADESLCGPAALPRPTRFLARCRAVGEVPSYLRTREESRWSAGGSESTLRDSKDMEAGAARTPNASALPQADSSEWLQQLGGVLAFMQGGNGQGGYYPDATVVRPLGPAPLYGQIWASGALADLDLQ